MAANAGACRSTSRDRYPSVDWGPTARRTPRLPHRDRNSLGVPCNRKEGRMSVRETVIVQRRVFKTWRSRLTHVDVGRLSRDVPHQLAELLGVDGLADARVRNTGQELLRLGRERAASQENQPLNLLRE